jgi:hypothetical protein
VLDEAQRDVDAAGERPGGDAAAVDDDVALCGDGAEVGQQVDR